MNWTYTDDELRAMSNADLELLSMTLSNYAELYGVCAGPDDWTRITALDRRICDEFSRREAAVERLTHNQQTLLDEMATGTPLYLHISNGPDAPNWYTLGGCYNIRTAVVTPLVERGLILVRSRQHGEFHVKAQLTDTGRALARRKQS